MAPCPLETIPGAGARPDVLNVGSWVFASPAAAPMLPTTPVALAFANTLAPRSPSPDAPEAAQVLQHLAALTQLLTPWDLQALELWPDAAARCGAKQVQAAAGSGLPDGQLVVHESPAGSHRAMLWSPAVAPWCQVWIDGQALSVPLGADGHPRTLHPGHWAGEDFFCLQTRIEHQPQQHGLWVRQISNGLHWQMQPEHNEHWPSPWARWESGVGLRVWADQARAAAGPVREFTGGA